KAPLTILKTLNNREHIHQYRPIHLNETMNISCEINQYRIASNGLEVDLWAVIKIGDEPVWECTKTFLFRGNFGKSDNTYQGLAKIPEPKTIDSWYLPGGVGFRFAKISGDTNGIHFVSWYARMLGFKRDFAQPILILENSIKRLPNISFNDPVTLDINYKGPIYYDSQILIKAAEADHGLRFDILNESNQKPCICALLKTKKRIVSQNHMNHNTIKTKQIETEVK
ncbi:MAG: hypothetical protein GY729_09070, partial [Desulfobacteraceae bacterium]|nr:hypothetical protein [Desulfobacteraceae bacterium]